MAGLYIHIPFCKSRCIYCGFYSTTATELIEEYTNAICKELELRKEYLHESVSTIYFGGGTPSLLSLGETARILNAIYIYNRWRMDVKSLWNAIRTMLHLVLPNDWQD